MSFEEEQEQVERIYIDMENRLLLNIAKKISRGKPMEIDRWDEETGQPIYGSGGVNEWQLERLKELNGLNKENAKIIASYSKKTVEEIEKIFDRAREIGTASDKRILEMGVKAGILNEINPTDESKQVKKIIKHAIREVLTTFNKQNNSLLVSAGEEYKEIVNNVSSKVLSGNKTVGSAIQEAVSRLAEKGLTGFTARNGAKWTPEAYTKMIMRTNTQNTINNIQEERLALAGNDYIEISKHSGARPKCADDQGQIFSLSGNTKPIVDGRGKKIKVRAWSSSSYGKPDGILGINCGHTRYAFVPNLSIHREPEFTKAENDADYLEKQQQRLYERSIRKKKREIQMLEEIKADKDYIKKKNNQLRDYRKEYTGFLNKTGRTRISSNEWIGTKEISSKNKTQSIKVYKNWKNKEEIEKQQSDIIKKNIVGKLDISKYTNDIIATTKDVVLLPERREHLKKHPEALKYIESIPNILRDPDYIYKELNKLDTVWIVKQLEDNVKITIKINTPNTNEKGYKNSIIQMQLINQKRLDKYEISGRIEKLFDKTNKK